MSVYGCSGSAGGGVGLMKRGMRDRMQKGMDMAKHILLVDDVAELTTLLRMTLEEDNHQVSVLDNGHGVVEFVRSNKPDVVILDLYLGDTSGITVLQDLKTNPDTHPVPVVVYTASILDAEKTQQMIDGEPDLFAGTRILKKPFALDELLSIVA